MVSFEAVDLSRARMPDRAVPTGSRYHVWLPLRIALTLPSVRIESRKQMAMFIGIDKMMWDNWAQARYSGMAWPPDQEVLEKMETCLSGNLDEDMDFAPD